MEHKFQINLGGIIDLLSNHLYSSPSVYVRELLQNGVDAITARREVQPDHVGAIRIEVAQSEYGRPQLIFVDDGIGLTEAQTHQFLSTIGESSKRATNGERVSTRRPTASGDFIGQFGIGLLSCFVVSDQIEMVTRSVEADAAAVQWRGFADGTYTTRVIEGDIAVGTTVLLTCKPGCEEWFTPQRVVHLVEQFGALLPFPILVTTAERAVVVNAEQPPWRCQYASPRLEHDARLAFGKRMFGHDFFDAIPLHSEVGDVQGIAYILPFTPSPTARRSHRVYLKNMLLSEASDNLLPSWAFFVTCIVNTNDLRPTASRESFYEDATLEATRDALGIALRQYLLHLREHHPERLRALIALHFRAIKALAVYDDEFFAMFVDWLPFETSFGRMTLGEFRRDQTVIRFVPSVDTFRQIAQVARSQGLGVINAGYSYDTDLLQKLPHVLGTAIERIDSTDLADSFTDLDADEREEIAELLRVGDAVLRAHKCRAAVKRFAPNDLPALYLAGDDVSFMRSLEQSRDVADEHWASILGNLAESSRTDDLAQLCFNFNNPLVRKLARLDDHDVLGLAIQMLYVQSLLMGHHPLNASEMALLNTGMLDLIELSISAGQSWVQ